MRIVYLPTCVQDLTWLRRYYSTAFPAGRPHAAEQFRKVRAALLANPEIGAPLDGAEGVREFPVARTPFSYVYRIRDDRIEILRIFDGRSQRA